MGRRLDRSIPDLLEEHGPATGPALADRLDVHPLTVERRCRALQREGRIRQGTGGTYALAGSNRRDGEATSD